MRSKKAVCANGILRCRLTIKNLLVVQTAGNGNSRGSKLSGYLGGERADGCGQESGRDCAHRSGKHFSGATIGLTGRLQFGR